MTFGMTGVIKWPFKTFSTFFQNPKKTFYVFRVVAHVYSNTCGGWPKSISYSHSSYSAT